ncbi:hypothetical protein F2Q70_00037393 [Brassica cretica]|uniref:Uncharacterized protein n=1 Tax=Brassica cretica TaxID=69181 RepID=A0A8S9JVG7_BRACR|nr:hypothetical protein F2Q70_00037393 [Brassica cretica]
MDYGYSKPVNLGEVPNHGKREKFGFKFPVFGCQLCALMFQAYGNCNCSSEHGKRAMLKSVPWHDLTPFFICFSGVPDPSSDDLGLFNLSSQTRRSQTARGQLADSSRPDQHVGQLAFPISAIRQLATTSAHVPISSSSRFISLVVHSTLLEVKVIRNLKENP